MSYYQNLSNAWRSAEVRWATEAGRLRCEAVTLKGTRCTRLSGLSKVSYLNNEWRCRQHGGR